MVRSSIFIVFASIVLIIQCISNNNDLLIVLSKKYI